MISIEPRGANLDAVTAETRRAALDAAVGGYVAQVWTWRGGEAVLVYTSIRSWPRSQADVVSVVRRGLRRGIPRLVHASSMAHTLESLGIRYRIKSARRRPLPPEPGSRAARRRLLGRVIRRRGNTWRTLRARNVRAGRRDLSSLTSTNS